jgi:hypothetical protein
MSFSGAELAAGKDCVFKVITEKIWGDVNQLLDEYGFGLDIVYSGPEFNDDLKGRYDKIFFWNETIN